MTEEELREEFDRQGADWNLTREILIKLNSGLLRNDPVVVSDFPSLDGRQILDLRKPVTITVPLETWRARTTRLFQGRDLSGCGRPAGGQWLLEQKDLERLGFLLASKTAFGVLNGGSATSYGDLKKNQALGTELFECYRADIERLAGLFHGRPKGITPAFFQPDGTPGPSYLELKMRHLLLVRLFQKWSGPSEGPGLTFFQMTSTATDEALRSAYREFETSPLLEELIQATGHRITHPKTARQDLIGTFTPATAGLPRRIFTSVQEGRETIYPLPGGHGQNFRVLREVYNELHREGYEFVYLGNVDNLGFLPSFKSLGLLALSGACAGFDFSFKTPVDLKGGVLFRDQTGRLNCGDIGVALPASEVQKAENAGKPILFNCATGLFDLAYLTDHLDRIIETLPLRLSEQDKDVGRYSQAEQITWEVMALLENPIVFGIEKHRRFVAAKLLLDCLLTSGLHLDAPAFDSPALAPIRDLASSLHSGLETLLQGPYGLKKADGRWVPLSIEELRRTFEEHGWTSLAV